jgi:phenylacetate-coenzyme A ligase PaaK-like adenylate-forming protein
MTEMGLGGGVFCEALNGYHLREADMLFEIVDPITGRSLPDGEFGEVVFTTLTRKGMPLIRYKTGDISRFLIEPCTCGTVLRTLDRVQHRISSSITLKSGQIITMPMLENIIFDIKDILDFDAEISQKDKEVLTIFINAFGDENQITKNIVNAINNSSIGDFIKSNTLELEILNQGAKELDIKALRKRNILDKRYL